MDFFIEFVTFDFPENIDPTGDEAAEIFAECLGETFEAKDEEDLKKQLEEISGYKVLVVEYNWERETYEDEEG